MGNIVLCDFMVVGDSGIDSVIFIMEIGMI